MMLALLRKSLKDRILFKLRGELSKKVCMSFIFNFIRIDISEDSDCFKTSSSIFYSKNRARSKNP